MNFRGAIFDVDGVLVDSPHEQAWREGLQQLMENEWRDIRPQTSYAPEVFTPEIYQRVMSGKPRYAGALAVLEYFGMPDPEERAREYGDRKQEMIVELIEAWYLRTNVPVPGSRRAEGSELPPAVLTEVVRLYGLRSWVEQSYKQVKQALGWAQYQVRSDPAIRRHWAARGVRLRLLLVVLRRPFGGRRPARRGPEGRNLRRPCYPRGGREGEKEGLGRAGARCPGRRR